MIKFNQNPIKCVGEETDCQKEEEMMKIKIHFKSLKCSLLNIISHKE